MRTTVEGTIVPSQYRFLAGMLIGRSGARRGYLIETACSRRVKPETFRAAIRRELSAFAAGIAPDLGGCLLTQITEVEIDFDPGNASRIAYELASDRRSSIEPAFEGCRWTLATFDALQNGSLREFRLLLPRARPALAQRLLARIASRYEAVRLLSASIVCVEEARAGRAGESTLAYEVRRQLFSLSLAERRKPLVPRSGREAGSPPAALCA